MKVSELKNVCAGTVTASDEPGFKDGLHQGLWNQLVPDRSPQVIVRAADENDIVAAIHFARANKLKVVVRGGGHNWCQPTLRNGGVLIDLQDLTKFVALDVENHRATIQPIISNREIQEALNPHGLAFPSGHCPEVKASGYLLGGGMAWNPTVWGSGAENVEAVDVVTANGELVHASESENPDLFWAARGAGPGFFGVVTKFHLKLHPLPKAIHGSTYFFCLNDAPAVGTWLGELAPTLAPCVELSQFIVQAPPEGKDFASAHNGWICMVTGTAFEDTPEAARAALQPLENSPVKPRSSSLASPLTFEQLFDASGALWPQGLRARVEAAFSNASPGDMMEAVWRKFPAAPSPASVFLFTIFCGPNVPAPPGNMAHSVTTKVYGGPWTMWREAKDDQANADWHHEITALLRPFNSAYYLGESNLVERPSNASQAYSPENWQRLADLRHKYDPDGIFFDYFDGLNTKL